MSTLAGRDKSALLVIDVQNGVVEGAYNLESVLKNINTAVAKARSAGVPVIWVQHSDDELVLESDDWQIVPQLEPASGERKVRKVHRSSFEATDLEQILADFGVGHLYITGMQTNNCVRHTTHSAQERGYDITNGMATPWLPRMWLMNSTTTLVEPNYLDDLRGPFQ
jgi:nicotinamidase-related amidase